MEIVWGYQSLPNGMPTEESLIHARSLYTGLDQAIGTNGIYVMSRTGGGGRTIYYYVHSVAHTSSAIHNFLDGQPSISVKVSASDDPSWAIVRNVVASTKD